AEFDCHVAPLVVDRIAAHGAGSVHPIAGGDQHRPRRRDHASDRDRTDGRDWLGERDDGNVICSEKRSVYRGEIWVPDETGDGNSGLGDVAEGYGGDSEFIWKEEMRRRQDRA